MIVSLTLGAIVEALGGRLLGAADQLITGLAPLQTAQSDHISFLSQARYQKDLSASLAGCVIVSPSFEVLASQRQAAIITDDPYLYFARLTRLWKQRHVRSSGPKIHPSAVIDPQATIAEDAVIGPLCVIERGASVGAASVLKSRVTLGEDCSIGARCIVHSGAVIGADGFGFAPHQGEWEKIEQLGAVRIGNDVEIGANTCIDRGALDDTIIEDGVKLLWLSILLETGRTFNLIVIAALRATGDSRYPFYAGAGSMAIVLAGGSWLLGVHFQWGLAGVWVAYAADEWIRGMLMWRRWLSLGWLPHAKTTHARLRDQRFRQP